MLEDRDISQKSLRDNRSAFYELVKMSNFQGKRTLDGINSTSIEKHNGKQVYIKGTAGP